MADRAQRVAFMLLPTLDHFVPDLIARLPAPGLEVRAFPVRGMADLAAACAWACQADDVIWFEFCWPPFPAMIAQHQFNGQRVIMRVHRIEAYETRHAATAPWHKIDDVIVVSQHMAENLRNQAPRLDRTTRLHVLHNGVDVERFAPRHASDPFRIGWCGLLTLRKNPTLALDILHLLRQQDPRWHLHMCSKDGEPVATNSFHHLKHRLQLDDAVFMDGNVPPEEMPAWHARNSLLLSTSLHESFGYAMAEAASCGCDVAMLDQQGAEEFWPPQLRFGTTGEAAEMIRSSLPGRWRQLIVHRFSLDAQIDKLRKILKPVSATAVPLHIPANGDLLELLPQSAGTIQLEPRSADEMEAAEFILVTMGYARAGKLHDGYLYQVKQPPS